MPCAKNAIRKNKNTTSAPPGDANTADTKRTRRRKTPAQVVEPEAEAVLLCPPSSSVAMEAGEAVASEVAALAEAVLAEAEAVAASDKAHFKNKRINSKKR